MLILITGATGFVGRHLVAECISRGWDVVISARSSSDISWVDGSKVRIVNIDFSDAQSIISILKDLKQEYKGRSFDYVAHLMGATKVKKKKDFYTINYVYTKNLVQALEVEDISPKRFLLMSSLSSIGKPLSNNTPLSTEQNPNPNTHYGKSKLLAEQVVASSNLNHVILLPTGIYGLYDRDYLKAINTACRGLYVAPRIYSQRLTFVYINDLVHLCMIALENEEMKNKRVIVSDKKFYTNKDFSKKIKSIWQIKKLIFIKIPHPLMWIICLFGSIYNRFSPKLTPLNLDKYNILIQRHWLCDTSYLDKIGFIIEYDLDKGLKDLHRELCGDRRN